VAGSEKVIEVRQLFERPEFVEAVQLQKTVWKFDDIDLLPVRLFVVANKIGGHVFGAYDGDRIVGFCLGIPGLKAGGVYYIHSHMLGVLTEYHNYGIGRRLKLAQRDDAVARGIDLIEWTFDPLEIKNAFFNMERLGAVVRRYVENQYGTTTSPLHGGLPTDRCTAEWWVSSPRVQSVLDGTAPQREIAARIAVPAEIDRIRREEPKRAREIQQGLAEQFHRHFDDGLAVVGFARETDQGVYLLGPLEGVK
jgi:predicted GNAT superfamily acetyltransferase